MSPGPGSAGAGSAGPLTVSVGGVLAPPGARDLGRLLRAADRALCTAKRAGGDTAWILEDGGPAAPG